ncbi:MAG: CocE/NonD family hydrolase [Planctomycetes bacterium]|nr:CocE/NonD family hydrolase [Planctomycetota bacterium]
MPNRTRFLLVLIGVLSAAATTALSAEVVGLEYTKAHYTKYEYRIPMRDGKRLFTAVYVPKDKSQAYPIMMTRTPYSVRPYGADQYRNDLGPSPLFTKEGYIFVYQDVRGRWMSEGHHENMRPHLARKAKPTDIDESTDTFDTIEWLINHVKGHNGRVGLYGISYPGFYSSAGMIDAHPALRAVSPQAPICDWFIGDDWHHNGALHLTHAFNFMVKFGRPRPEPTKKFDYPFEHGTPDGYDFFLRMGPLAKANLVHMKDEVAFWHELMRHGTYDEFWKARNLRPHLQDIRPAVMTVGGWFDAENLFGALETYRAVERQSPQTNNTLVMGPWSHGGWARGDGDRLGDATFNSKTSEFYRETIELNWFERHLKDKGAKDHPEAWIFHTGTNEWHRYDAWPPQQAVKRTLYLKAKGGLGFESSPKGDVFEQYVSDPARPVPHTDKISNIMAVDYMTADQRFASRRTDVLTFATDELPEDITLAGPLEVDLWISSSGTDSDFVVKLIDVYPDDLADPNPNPTNVRLGGYQQLVRGDIMRAKFRDSFEKPTPLKPNEPTRVRFTLQDVAHVFRPGHRLMVQVQSSWFPLFDRNPQTFTDIYSAKPEQFEAAAQRVYVSGDHASHIDVYVLP